MSVLIKGMEMQKGCIGCPFKDIGMDTMTQCILVAGWVKYADDGNGIPDACPLVEVPTPHGRLIDAGTLLTERRKSKYYHLTNGDIAIPVIDIEHAPTVIEAEEKDED